MNNIYQNAIQAVENGSKFKVDFQSRSLKIDGKYVIENSKYEGDLGVTPCNEDEVLKSIEELYCSYKHSIPSERSESKSHQYFTALPERCLGEEAMLYGERRDKAQIELELYVLCQIINGFKWDSEKMGKWFWKSKVDKDLVILKKWVETDSN